MASDQYINASCDEHCGALSSAVSVAGEMLHDFARIRAVETPDRVALIFDDGTEATFEEVQREAIQVAAALDELGLTGGETVSFILPNWREAIPIAIACSMLGLTVNPIIPIYRDAECRHILNDAATSVLFAPGVWRGFDYLAMAERVCALLSQPIHVVAVRVVGVGDDYEKLLERGRKRVEAGWLPTRNVDPDSAKMLLYTSGTTGPAKGVVHSHKTLSAARRGIAEYWRLDADDVMIMPSPVTHVTGYMMGIEFPFFEGGKSALMSRWDADRAVEMVDRVGATATVGATPFLQELLDASERRGSELPTMRLFACGGAAVPPDLIRRAQAKWPTCRTFRIYGSSEAPGVTAGWIDLKDADLAATTDGRIVGWDVQTEGTLLGANVEGELRVRGPGLFVGYRREEDNREAFTDEGYFLTGDLGRITLDSAIVITGRKKDLIIRGGENLSAKEIEDTLHRHPSVKEAAVIAMPHERLGEGVCAFIVIDQCHGPVTALELAEFVQKSELAPQKIPERFEFCSELPKTASGKVRKDVLRREVGMPS